uniref:hypothetical protein n=1 Tax=Thaumasiovibrio subtropicus TaxID=1891207 RepID=UPI00131E63A6|nr:hypothetical protein [Thaumasiovibrio subtropicus]
MNYIHRMTLYLVLLFIAFVAVFVDPSRSLTLSKLIGILALIIGLSVEYLMAPESDPK